MRQFGLIGFPLGHSFSKKYFEDKFATMGLTDCCYDNFEIEYLTELPKSLTGFNVTIPHKQAVMALLSSVDPAAQEIGAVNCVDVNLCGYNTDIIGFEQSLVDMIGINRPSALVLGSGGASKAVVYVLKRLGIEYQLVSRSGDLNYDNLTAEIIASCHLIINTTPLGMYPKTEVAPRIDYSAIGSQHYLYDLVYNPALTEFLKRGLKRGSWVKNGLAMLHLQAEAAWDIWNREF